jgi:hypothetical protein
LLFAGLGIFTEHLRRSGHDCHSFYDNSGGFLHGYAVLCHDEGMTSWQRVNQTPAWSLLRDTMLSGCCIYIWSMTRSLLPPKAADSDSGSRSAFHVHMG